MYMHEKSTLIPDYIAALDYQMTVTKSIGILKDKPGIRFRYLLTQAHEKSI